MRFVVLEGKKVKPYAGFEHVKGYAGFAAGKPRLCSGHVFHKCCPIWGCTRALHSVFIGVPHQICCNLVDLKG